MIAGVPSDSYKIRTADLKDGVVAILFASSPNFQDDIRERASIYVPNVGKVRGTNDDPADAAGDNFDGPAQPAAPHRHPTPRTRRRPRPARAIADSARDAGH